MLGSDRAKGLNPQRIMQEMMGKKGLKANFLPPKSSF